MTSRTGGSHTSATVGVTDTDHGARVLPPVPPAGWNRPDRSDPLPEPTPGGDRGRRPLLRGQDAVRRVRDRALGTGDEPAGRGDRPVLPARLLFVLAVVGYTAHQVLTRTEYVLGGAMWAETATNYYAATVEEPWYRQLLATDAGYLPLPQRLVALVGDVLGVPAAVVPWFYTGTALLASGLLVGSICLPAFRAVVSSDGLRFAIATAIALLPDFETRSFINFTYFAVVTAGFLAALAVADRDRDVPAWAWVLPVLMISKPAVLTVLPAVLVAALVSHRRFRWVALASAVAGGLQVLRLAVSSRESSSLLQTTDATLQDKLIASVKYTLGMLGRLFVGPATTLGLRTWMVVGALVLLACLGAVLLLRTRASALALVGVSLVLFTMVVNSFTFSAFFSRDLPMLGMEVTTFDRRYVVAVVGVVFVVGGLLAALTESPRVLALVRRGAEETVTLRRAVAAAAVVAFAGWFLVSGWWGYARTVNAPLPVPASGISQWDTAAERLSGDDPLVCIPLDPFGWHYGRGCGLLSGQPVDPATVSFVPPGALAGDGPLRLATPDAVAGDRVAAIAVVVRPAAPDQPVRVTGQVTTADGETTTLRSTTRLDPAGGAVVLTVPDGRTVDEVDQVVLRLEGADGLATTSSAPDEPLALWMGRPGD